MANGNHTAMAMLALGIKYDPNDIYIAVMGRTGAGKSTFITHLYGEREDGPKIGHHEESCTEKVEVFSYNHQGRNIHLIDTPGLDDTWQTEMDVLKEIAFWLTASYRNQLKLSGLIYLHAVNERRTTGSCIHNLDTFRKLCGDDALHTVVLATTMWGDCAGNKSMEQAFEDRHNRLLKNERFWDPMIDLGSTAFKHENNRASASTIIQHILDKQQRPILQLQREMVDDGKDLDQTAAGREVQREILEQKRIHQEQLRALAASESKKRQDLQCKVDEADKHITQLRVNLDQIVQERNPEFLRQHRQVFRPALRAGFGTSLAQAIVATGSAALGIGVGVAAISCNVM